MQNSLIVSQNWDNNGSPDSWIDYVKYYVKETSNEYYNLVMDRWYNAGDSTVWLSFNSADRNKVDEDTFLILKKGIESSELVREAARYKILSIQNEAPDFVKTSKYNIGDIKQAHAAAIEMYIQDHVGMKQDGTFGDLYFNDLLNDWSRFDINKRTKFDASISSGLAIMANNRHLYAPNAKVEKQPLNINISKYSNTGSNSQIIK